MLYNGYNENIKNCSITNYNVFSPSSAKFKPTSDSHAQESYVINSLQSESKPSIADSISTSTSKSSDPFTPKTFTAVEAKFHVDGTDDIDIRPRILDKLQTSLL